MKIFLIVTYLFLGQFPTKMVIEVPDMKTCEAIKAHMIRVEPANANAKLECVSESKS